MEKKCTCSCQGQGHCSKSAQKWADIIAKIPQGQPAEGTITTTTVAESKL